MKKYKYISILMLTVMILSCLSACGKSNNTVTGNSSDFPSNNNSEGKQLKIVTTIFPEYDWVKQILGDISDNAEITMLLDNGVDLHSYQPTTEDIMKISNCDLFIYVGGESDEWVEGALQEAVNKDMKVINLLDVLGDSVKTEETVEGMQEEHNHEHSHDEEITIDDIADRTLSDFDGEWKSLYPYLLNGDLDDYCEHKAEDDDDSNSSMETYYEKYKSAWACEIDHIKINNNQITFTYSDGKTVTAEYTYAGYQTTSNEDGAISSVRYQFETDNADAPKFVQFNDHGHEPGKAEHFHIYFGNNSFEELMDSKTNPFFVKESLSVDEILEELLGHEHEEEKDEHVWLSLKNAQILCQTISDTLQEIDPENKDVYSSNASAYIEKLFELDTQYQAVTNAASQKTLLFGDRFPFRYLVDDYGLSYYAAFAGCSAETEASFETITFLASKVDELHLNNVITLEKSDQKIAQTIIQNTQDKNQKILVMDSMQSTTSEDILNGTTYLSVMESNLDVLQEALK